ncbi:ATP-dependent Lon protease [Vibrio algarum]|uniref:ATP-dependent Lon protease n=1 Tax=Vibrio algarum TaxID=3020714 RepID=A0ABT4YLR5_9VIBR|nr:ATP-dependent Lon protease [Vibrio sp. KJ40-1]MDB1122487.1 ATP-dependent Lon protease [Vibrio sp. KJ40-1]
MIVSPTNVNVPLIAPSVNVQTEQAARDNKVREPVTPPVELAKSNAERRIKADDKRRKRPAWEASDHPDYGLDNETNAKSAQSEEPKDTLSRLFELLALQTYSEKQGLGYTIRFRLPKKLIDAAITLGKMERRRTVIKYHYGHAVAPNCPSEVIAVL